MKVNVNNYIRAGGKYFFFDDTSEWGTRSAFKQAEKIGLRRVVYKIPTVGWFVYMNGTSVIIPCPEGYHEYRMLHNHEQACIRCSLKEKPTDED